VTAVDHPAGDVARDRIGREVQLHTEVASTNDLARAAALAGEREGLVIVADVQTAGRGRLGRAWQAPPGTCLLMSILFRPPEPIAPYAARTTMVCGLALRESVRALVEDGPAAQAQLKWPNDLIVPAPERPVGWAKLAGMLSEIVLDAEQRRPLALIVGIGLNVNVPPAALADLGPHATSLLALLGRAVDRTVLLQGLVGAIDRRYGALRRGVDPFPAWQGALAWLGETVEVHGPQASWEGVAETVDETGALWLRTGDGQLRAFSAGDVSLRPGKGRVPET